MKKITQIIWGLAIIALGVVFAGNALGWFDINIFFNGWWTLFIIVPSVIDVFTEDHKTISFLFLCAGILLLLAAQEVFGYDVAWKVIGSIILVVLGLSIIYKSIFKKDTIEIKIKKIINNLDDDDDDDVIDVEVDEDFDDHHIHNHKHHSKK